MRTRTSYEIMLRFIEDSKSVNVFTTLDYEEAYNLYEILKEHVDEQVDVVLLKLEWHCVSTTPLQCS